ncbi:unnamed protein product [Mycetohabitans rhizoxinica HKI 454]|uniref:Uncharacterized protein n=1 Tax=Mycetohabitans rhizoxinica (strain DSM 19002 / CIP 109453 / HKI 454) TaxID=882378 RepID=E5ALJ1_MYCRK|nr:unnamed protein product [Mycetohabitans rhizoxinica HKI 454]
MSANKIAATAARSAAGGSRQTAQAERSNWNEVH